MHPAINHETPLASLGLHHLDMVLDEMFYVPPASLFPELLRPTTVGELAARTKLPVDGVIRYLRTIMTTSVGIEISAQELQTMQALRPGDAILLDVRERWEFDICHLPGSILLEPETFPVLLARLQGAANVVVICHHGVRSYSAAMYLREKGVASARSLAGGLDLWARTIDAGMARY